MLFIFVYSTCDVRYTDGSYDLDMILLRIEYDRAAISYDFCYDFVPKYPDQLWLTAVYSTIYLRNITIIPDKIPTDLHK